MKFDTGNNLLACSQTPVWEHNSSETPFQDTQNKTEFLNK